MRAATGGMLCAMFPFARRPPPCAPAAACFLSLVATLSGCSRGGVTPPGSPAAPGPTAGAADVPVADPAPPAPAEIEALREQVLASADAATRARLVRELGLLGDLAARDFLLERLRDDPADEVALAAADALRRLALAPVAAALETRASATADRDRRTRLADAAERYQAMTRGQALPGFLRRPPPPFTLLPPERPSVRILAFGDQGDGSERQARTARAMQAMHAKRSFDLGIVLGDNFYPDGVSEPDSPRFALDWARHYDPLDIPLHVVTGNHDWLRVDGPAAQVVHGLGGRARTWRMPALRYTFVAGPAQLFAIDTTLLSLAQTEWLRRALDDSRARWKIVFGHHPIASDGWHGDEAALRAILLPVLRGRAHVYVCGHDHDLQHLRPEDGVHFLVTGGGGARPRPLVAGPRTRFARSGNGFLVLEASRTSLVATFVGDDGRELYRTHLDEGDDRPAIDVQP